MGTMRVPALAVIALVIFGPDKLPGIAHSLGKTLAHGIEAIIDVRRFPGSRRLPQFESSALEHALAILGADEATHMAVGGGEKRAEAMSALAGMHHRQATAPEIADWIAAAESEALNEEQAAALAEFKRHYTNLTCLPVEFVERQTAARMRSSPTMCATSPKARRNLDCGSCGPENC